jgi:hypothetical protein
VERLLWAVRIVAVQVQLQAVCVPLCLALPRRHQLIMRLLLVVNQLRKQYMLLRWEVAILVEVMAQ